MLKQTAKTSTERARHRERERMAKPPEVQVELYIRGQGPARVFKETLKGWDQNRLDLERIMRTHKLQAIYAFSLSDGRGNRLLANPRNGLSHIAYSGRPDVLIRLDGEPSESFSFLLAKILFGFVLIAGLAFLTLSESLPEWLSFFKDSGRSYIVVLLCFVTMLYTQLVWRPMKKNRFMSYGYVPGLSWQKEELSKDGPSEDKKDS